MKLKIKSKVNKSDLYKDLLQKIELREQKLLDGNHISAGLYLDPRVKFLLNEDQKKIAINHIKFIGERLNLLQPFETGENSEEIETLSNDENESSSSDMEEFLNEKAKEATEVNQP